MRSVRRSTVAALSLTAVFAVVAAIGSAAIQAPAYAAGSITATFTKTSDWGNGYEAKYTITNGTSTSTSSWNLQFDLPSGQHVSSIWGDPHSVSGQHVTITNANWDGVIAPGGSLNVGFDIGYSGTWSAPTGCTINGGSCAGGGGGGDTAAPSAPGNLHSTGVTSSSVSLAWNASTDNVGVTGYDVYRGSSKVGSVSGTSYTDGGLSASTSYSYTVKARDAAGNTSAASNTASATTSSGGGGGGGGDYVTTGYFAQWGVYQRAYYPKNLVTSGTAAKLDILNYAFENIDPNNHTCFEAIKAADTNDSNPNAGDGAGDAYADYQKSYGAADSISGVADTWNQPLKGNFNQLKQLKALYPSLKIVVSIGGWTYSKFFSDAAATSASRQAFVSSCIDMFIKGNLPTGIGGDPAGGVGAAAGIFDGIDLDWEYPGTNTGHAGNHYSAADKANFVALAAEFRRQLDAYGATTGKDYLLTAFVSADPAKVSAGFDVPGLMPSFDYASVQGYDLHGSWETTTNHQSSLYVPPGDPSPQATQFSVDLAINTWINAGAPKSKLLLGVPFYGRGWTGVTNANNGLFQPSTGAAPGTYQAGYEDYKVLKTKGYTVYRDNADGVAWLFNGSTFWTYDDPTAMGQKTAYVKSKDIGGVMIWSLDGDDSSGSLISAINSGLS